MAQRRQAILTIDDTVWQRLNLHLEGLTIAYCFDSMASVANRPEILLSLEADMAQVQWERHNRSVVQKAEQHIDTTMQRQETAEAMSRSLESAGASSRRPWRLLWLLLLPPIVWLGCWLWHRSR